MHIPININVMNECVKVIKKYPEMAIPVSSSFASSQLISKIDIVQDIENNLDVHDICILAGWFCIGFKLLFNKSYNIISVDKDGVCEKIGKQLFNDVTFVTSDLVNYKPQTDVVINTSTEHIERDALRKSFRNILPDTLCYFQNNNIDWYEGHINCFESLQHFVDFISEYFDIVDAYEIDLRKPRFKGKRYTIKCMKKHTYV